MYIFQIYIRSSFVLNQDPAQEANRTPSNAVYPTIYKDSVAFFTPEEMAIFLPSFHTN